MASQPDAIRTIQKFQISPPVNLSGIAKELGIRVWEKDFPSEISGEICLDPKYPDDYSIFIRAADPYVRKRFTLAHEIAHYLLHKPLIGDGIKDSSLYRSDLSDAVERDANSLAAEILMPAGLLQDLLSEGVKDSHKIADRLKVSEAALRVRFGLPT